MSLAFICIRSVLGFRVGSEVGILISALVVQ